MFAMTHLLMVPLAAAAAVATSSDPVCSCPPESGDGPRVIRLSPEQTVRWTARDVRPRRFLASSLVDEFQPAVFRGAWLDQPLVVRAASISPQDVIVKRDGQSVTRSKSVIVITDESGELKVVDENGQVQAFRDGKPVPPDRIRRQDGKIIIMDENGKVLREVGISAGAARIRMGDMADALTIETQPEGAFKVLGLGGAPKPRIGVSLGAVDPALAEHLGIDPQGAFVITAVEEGLPAAKAGLQKNDIVVRVNEETADPDRLRELVAGSETGDEIRLRVLRKGQPQDIVVKVEKVADSNHPVLRLDALDGKLGDIERRILRLMPEGAQKLREFRVHVDRDQDFDIEVDVDHDTDSDVDHDADLDVEFDRDFMRHFDALRTFDIQIDGVPAEALQKLRERIKAGELRVLENFDPETVKHLREHMQGVKQHMLHFIGEQDGGIWREQALKALKEALDSNLADKVDQATREKVQQKVREALDKAAKAGDHLPSLWRPFEQGVVTFELAPSKEGGQVMILPEIVSRAQPGAAPGAPIEHRLEALEARLAKLEALLEKLSRNQQPLP